MTTRLLRNLLVVAGAYWLGEWLASLIGGIEAALGVSVGGVGGTGLLVIAVWQAVPRTIAAAGGAALLWLTLGSEGARRSGWGLAGLFAVTGWLSRYAQTVAGPSGQALNIAVFSMLPALACLATAWLLGRAMPSAPEAAPAAVTGDAPTHGQSRGLLIAGGVLALLVGVSAGAWITSSMQMQQMSGWMLAAIDSARRSNVAFAQYREANYDEAKVALEQFAAYLEKQTPAAGEWQPGQAPLLDARGLAFDRMLTYGRLALRAERAHRADDATRSWQRAEQQARALQWTEPARDRIRETVTRLDAEPRGRPPSR